MKTALGFRIRKAIVVTFTAAGVLLAINYIFNLEIGHVVLWDKTYLFAVLACFLPQVFLIRPARKSDQGKPVPWYDWILFLIALACTIYLATRAFDIYEGGWVSSKRAPLLALAVSILLWPIVIEAVRRVGGLLLSLVYLAFSMYPLFASYMIGPLRGTSQDFLTTAKTNSMVSLVGVTTNVFGTMLIGFMLFGAVLDATGAGKRVIDLAMSLFGGMRGGAGKVGVLAGTFFGIASGSGVSNVVACGSITIPMMKKAGYSGEFAGAVSATSAIGGQLSPPIMGAAAFIMASFLNIPYLAVCVAAIIPSVFYYLCIFVQVDARAVKEGVKAIDRSQLPPMRETLKGIWIVAVPIVALVLFMYYARNEAQAPFYATGLLLILVMLPKSTRLNIPRAINVIENSGKILTDLVAILAGVGFIIGGLFATGVAPTLTGQMISFAGGNLVAMLIFVALANILLGLGVTVTITYIVLAVMAAPGLIKFGLDPVAVHLYILYIALLSDLTPPVAVSPLVAAGIAKASFMKTCVQAMRLGFAAYLVPFFFILEPALIGHGTIPHILYAFTITAVGLTLISGSFEGYLPLIGMINGVGRVAFCLAGALLALPYWQSHIGGAAIFVIAWSVRFVLARVSKGQRITPNNLPRKIE